jgi:NFU1 iron-sulfur cluster scaffold homolog, mitochondrial
MRRQKNLPNSPLYRKSVPFMGYQVKEIQPTPNPNAAKFVLDRAISDTPISFLNPQQGTDHPVAGQLFSIQGVTSVLILGDFVTINKDQAVKWSDITQKVQEILQKCD